MTSPLINRSLDHRLKLYAAKGSKASRRATVRRVRRFIDFCQRPAEQVGRRQVHEFYEQGAFSPSTQRNYYYAICLLWRLLGRNRKPPMPPTAEIPKPRVFLSDDADAAASPGQSSLPAKSRT